MATFGEAGAPFSGRPAFHLRTAISRVEVDQANNRSRWSWSTWVANLDGSSSTWAGGSFAHSSSVNGSVVSNANTPNGVFDFRDGASVHQIASGTTGWIQHGADGNKRISFSGAVANASIFGSANNGDSIAADRINHPAHSSLSVARNSDTQHTLSWTRNGTYTGAVVQRRTNGGSWQQVGAPSGNVASYVDKTTVANRKYEYRVAGKAANAQSGWSNVATVYTTPAVPTGVSAVRSGDDIVVNASGKPPYATSYDVRDGATVVGTSVSLPWTHVDPDPAVAHSYTVRAKVGSLNSGYSAASNTVQLLTPPNPPVSLSPNGSVVPSDEDVTFRWVHNPVDSSPQSVFELRYREPGAGSWEEESGSTVSELAVGLPVGEVEWQVRTKGAHPDWSAWSSLAVFEVVDRPGVAILSPDTTWDASVLPVEWSFFQAQSRPQSSWQVRLLSNDEIVETRSGSGSATSVTLNTRLTAGEWTVTARAAIGEVWSEWATASFTVVFDPPAPPLVEGVWDDSQGGVQIAVGAGVLGGAVEDEEHGGWYAQFPVQGESNIGFDDGHPYIDEDSDEGFMYDGANVMIAEVEPPPTVAVVLERSIDGEEWEPVAQTEDVAVLIDWEAWSYGDIKYRATAFTAEGAATSTTVVVEARSEHIWLSGGPGFGVTARLPFDPSVQVTAGRARALKQYAGRSLPVAYTGEAVSRVVSVAGVTMQRSEETAQVDDLASVAQLPDDVFMFRDPDGRRVYGQIGQVDLPRQVGVVESDGFNAFWGYSFTLTETEPR